MSTCRLEPEYIKSILTIIEDYLYFEDNIDLSDKEEVSNLEEAVVYEMNQQGFEDFDSFNLKDYISESKKDFKPKLEKILETYGVEIPRNLLGTPSMNHMKTNISKEFTTYDINDKFHTLPMVKLGFDNYLNLKITKAAIIGSKDSKTFVTSNEEVTNNLNDLKSELFDEIQTFLINNKLLKASDKKPLFNPDGSVKSYTHYTSVMKKLENYFFNGKNFNIIKSYNELSKVPNIEGSDEIDTSIREAYYNGIILNNFDTVISSTGLIDVNYNQYNNLWTDPNNTKYRKKFEGLKTAYFKDDSHASEAAASGESNLLKLIIGSIPAYNKKGEPTGNLLETKDFYLFAAKLSDFELLHGNALKNKKNSDFLYFNENPSKALMWYINNILNEEDGKFVELKEHFKYNKEFALSLKNFLESPEYNIQEKEKNSDDSIIHILSQIINNSFGAAYITYDSKGKYIVRAAYDQNFSQIRIQDRIFNKMYHNSSKNLYDKEKDFKKIDELFGSIKFDNIVANLSKITISQKAAITNFIYYKTGIKLNYNSFDDFIKDLSRGNELSTVGVVNMLKDLLTKLASDFETVKTNIDENVIKSISRGDVETSSFISETIQDSTFKALSNAYLINDIIKPLMNLKTLSGETIPTFKLANVTYKDTEVLQNQREKEEKNSSFGRVYESLFLKDSPLLLGTNTKLELNNKDVNKAASKFNVSESFVGDFLYGFLYNIVKNNKFDVMIGNYSDKSTILTKVISSKFQIGKQEVVKMSVSDIQKLVKTQSQNYYKDLMKSIISDYSILFDETYSTKNIAEINESVKLINQRLSEIGDITSLSLKASKKGIAFTKELHYSFYDGKATLNQLIVDNYNIFNNDKLYKTFVKRQEQSFIEGFKKYNKSVDSNNIKLTNNLLDIKKDVLPSLGLEDSQFDKTEDGEVDYLKLQNNAGTLNPMLRKWMWLNALYRNEYLYMTGKGEYMHPAKGLPDRSLDNTINFDAYMKESSSRLKAMAKRNVMYTATIEIPPRKTKFGVPENINHAVIEDFKAKLYNISGDTKNQDAHDGSSLINYVYSKMVDNSYPGKGYEGTKKPFGTFITDYGVVIKKDAESVITNDKIRNSRYSDISYRNKQKQMLSIPIENLKMDLTIDVTDKYSIINGLLNKITKVIIKDNNVQVNYRTRRKDGNWTTNIINTKFNNLFELWELFGAEFSTDEHGNFNEGSNDLLYQVVTSPDAQGNFVLKDKLIHIISSASAVKAGGSNINSRNLWTNSDELAYSTFKNRFMGPQLDASHKADASEIKEITQVISALAQNPATAHFAQEAYQDIANIIKKAMQPYLRYLAIDDKTERIDSEGLYDYIAERFVKTLNNTKGDNIAKVLVHSFEQDLKIPFSNQNFYVAFVRDIITKMNNEFITRYYSGIGAVLIPSHGIVQVFEDEYGNIKMQEDVIKETLLNPSNDGTLTNEQLISNYINYAYSPKSIDWVDIEIGDTVLIKPEVDQRYVDILNKYPELYSVILGSINTDNIQEEDVLLAVTQKLARFLKWNYGEDDFDENSLDYSNFAFFNAEDAIGFEDTIEYTPLKLSTPEEYYKVKERSSNKIIKDFSKPRDLKPSSLKFTLANGEKRNQYDLDSVKLLFKYNELLEKGTIDNSSFTILEKFANYVIPEQDFRTAYTNKTYQKVLRSYLGKWTNLSLHLLKDNKVLAPVTEDVQFNEFFYGFSLTDNVQDIKHQITNTVPILSYTLDKAEIIMGDMNRSKFNRELYESMSQIIAEKEAFFANKMIDFYAEDDTDADVKILVNNHDSPIYVKYVDEKHLPGIDNSINIKAMKELTDSGVVTTFVRYNDDGEVIYKLPQNARVRKENGKEIIYIQGIQSLKNEVVGMSSNFIKDSTQLYNSFRNNMKAFIPLMNNKTSEALFSTGKYQTNLNYYTIRSFSRYSGYMPTNRKEVYTSEWFNNNNKNIVDQLSRKAYASWEKSRELIAARIPAQSTQSFMEMKQVGYLNSHSNDAYVSLWQIWLQGSDFDIDKAYILSSGFNGSGQMDLWTNISQYSSIEQLNELEKLPIPSGIKVEFKSKGVDLTEEFNMFYNYFDSLQSGAGKSFFNQINSKDSFNLQDIFDALKNSLDLEIPTELPAEIIRVLNSAIRKVNLNKGITINGNTDKEVQKIFIRLIDQHNSFEGYSKSKHSINNAVVSRIKQVISDPTSQILANSPVDVQSWHDAIKAVLNKKGLEPDSDILSPYDMFSMYKQQYDASVGKDDVGIAANGLKVFFALSSYYNDYYKNKFEVTDTEVRRSFKTFSREFVFVNEGEKITYKPSSVSDVYIPKQVKDKLLNVLVNPEFYDTDAALALSSFTSAATDNAKELIMAQVNANSELASMHIYLMILGFTPEQVVEIMTSDIVTQILTELEVNMLYPGARSKKVGVILDKMLSAADKNSDDYYNIKSISDIYNSAQEIKTLAKILGVNQKTSANTEELYNYLNTLNTAVLTREHYVLGKDVELLKNWEEFKDSEDPIKVKAAEADINIVIEKILDNNPHLNRVLDRSYVKKVLTDASSIDVSVINEAGVIEKRTVSLLGGQFDYRYFMLDINEDYKRITKEYYNLIKGTFNIFDIIDEVPHFKQMIQGLNMAHNILSASSVKYNSVHTVLVDYLKESWHRIDFHNNENMTNYMGNKSFMPALKENNISKFMLGIDMRLKSKWLKSKDTEHLTFNVNQILKQVNSLLPENEKIESFTVYNSDEAMGLSDKDLEKTNSKLITKVNLHTPSNEPDTIITLSTNYGIANFKKLMEELLLPIVKNKSNIISESLATRTVNNILGIRGSSIESTFPLSDISTPYSLALSKRLLKAFNDLDIVETKDHIIRNANNVPLKWRDLFYVYNLLVNNEKYGDLRLTPLFQDYLKEKNSLGNKFISYASKLDSHEIRLFNLDEEVKNHPLYSDDLQPKELEDLRSRIKKEIENDILFYTFNDRGVFYIYNSSNDTKKFSVQNPNFVVITSINETEDIKKQWLELHEIKRLIKNNGFIVKFEC